MSKITLKIDFDVDEDKLMEAYSSSTGVKCTKLIFALSDMLTHKLTGANINSMNIEELKDDWNDHCCCGEIPF